jgi:hypothetical protein
MLARVESASGQTPSRPAVLPVDSLAWLCGRWLAADDFSMQEGVWTRSAADTITGRFAVTEGNRTVRRDLYIIAGSPSGPLLSRTVCGSSSHDSGRPVPWKDLRLRESGGMRAVFSPSSLAQPLVVTLELITSGRLRMSVGSGGGEGPTETTEYSPLAE